MDAASRAALAFFPEAAFFATDFLGVGAVAGALASADFRAAVPVALAVCFATMPRPLHIL
ncbi:hypothetical protein [Streptomyces sp. CC77]|uniref:hypothetical protein n=1 Tax=Streptomyces sp. CC77 TaxID=1906739 RepID=UPI001587EA32|nr:hypothetical protein [Streptomyces sp. CC77]